MSDEPEPLPKVLVEVAGQPMLHWVVRACREAGVRRCVIVIGYRGDLVRERFADVPGCVFVEQTQQLGTGHAARMAAPLFEGEGDRDVYVLGGDGPLIRSRTLRLLLDTHRRERAAATLATSVLDDPTGYGRVLRDSDGGFARIVEQKDAHARRGRGAGGEPELLLLPQRGRCSRRWAGSGRITRRGSIT